LSPTGGESFQDSAARSFQLGLACPKNASTSSSPTRRQLCGGGMAVPWLDERVRTPPTNVCRPPTLLARAGRHGGASDRMCSSSDFITDDAYISFRYAPTWPSMVNWCSTWASAWKASPTFCGPCCWPRESSWASPGCDVALSLAWRLGRHLGPGGAHVAAPVGPASLAWHLVAPALLASRAPLPAGARRAGDAALHLPVFLGFDLLLAEMSSKRGFASA